MAVITGRAVEAGPIRVDALMTPAAELTMVAPDASLREVADALANHSVSGVPVVDRSGVVGVVSATDLLDFAAGSPEPLVEEPVGDDGNDFPAETPDSDDGKGSPFLDLWMDSDAELVERFAAGRDVPSSSFEEHTAEEVMTRRLITIAPDATVRAAAERMTAASVHRLLVMEEGRLLGIVTATDVLRAVADGRLSGLTD
jgi:CBS domain-containing protein